MTLADPYRLRVGKRSDRSALLTLMQQAYRELYPSAVLDHLAVTTEQLWSTQTPTWFVETAELTQLIGCLWLGHAIDQGTGDRYAHIFLLYVEPSHRRRGLGRALMQQAETWALVHGSPSIGLHVVGQSTAARSLYGQLGYIPQATFMQKNLGMS
ncbi:MAG: GNAT family N-acetyltransferase [Thermosynechococcaceae cyanobacterium]